jgi:dTDP-4-dehydrorhamnose 3,5-epimerase
MDSLNIEGVNLIPLRTIKGELGNVMHALKNSDSDFINFGEAYFSTIDQGKIKGWKKHRQMIMNIIVPQGKIKFVLFDDRFDSSSYKQFFEIILSPVNYQRLTVPPKVWMGFQGISPHNNLLLNIANIPHDPNEVRNLELSEIKYNWS